MIYLSDIMILLTGFMVKKNFAKIHRQIAQSWKPNFVYFTNKIFLIYLLTAPTSHGIMKWDASRFYALKR